MITEALAIDGGIPRRHTPFPAWPFFARDEIDAVLGVLKSGGVNYWTGNECKLFEKEFAAAFGKRYGIALANGTLALELALYALDIGPGDEVIVPSRTFIGTASCVIMRGARPVVVDIDPVTGNLTAETVAQALTSRTRAIIPVHMAGWPCDMTPLLNLAACHGVHIIEDCAQSHGASFEGRPVGSFGICAGFSFCQDKIITTGGEGGMLITDDEALWRRAWEYKDHGKSWDAVHNRRYQPGFRYLHESFGTNWRMTEMQAAIGRRQLKKLPKWLSQRKINAMQLAAGLEGLVGIKVSVPDNGIEHAWYKFYALLDLLALKPEWDQSRVLEAINAEGIPCVAGSCSEIYREKAFIDAQLVPKQRLPNAEIWTKSTLAFLVHPMLGESEIIDTVFAVRKVMRAATR